MPKIIDIAPGISAARLNDIIDTAPSGTEIQFTAGLFHFNQPIHINRSDISLKGSGSNRTTFIFNHASNAPNKNGIMVLGGTHIQKSPLAASSKRGSHVIKLQLGHGFSAGDVLHVSQPNTKAYLAQNNWDNVSWKEAANRPFREQLHIVENVDGNTITLKTPLAYNFEKGVSLAYSTRLLKNISISGFTVSYAFGVADPNLFENSLPLTSSARAISLDGTRNLSLFDVNIFNSASKGLYIARSIGAKITNLTIRGSHNKGGGGNGYGVELHEAFNNQLNNLKIFDMRHSIIFSAWHAETGNSIHIADTNRDINFHGSPDRKNTVIVDRARQSYRSGSRKNVWRLVSAGGTNHAETDFMASNRVEFTKARASRNHDTLYASIHGAKLEAGDGNDVLIGNDGDDLLVGGPRRDRLTGGGGSDRFLFSQGDDLDTITDFNVDQNGDLIVFEVDPSLHRFDDLALKQIGNDVSVRYGKNSTIILQNIQLAALNSGHFEFVKSK